MSEQLSTFESCLVMAITIMVWGGLALFFIILFGYEKKQENKGDLKGMKNTGKRFLTVMARINLVVEGKANYGSYKARELECIPDTFEEAEQLYSEIDALMHKYGAERT